MADITITIDDRAVRALLSRAPGKINTAMRGAMTDATTLGLARMKRYPSPPSGSTYTRTHILEKSWSRRIEGGGLSIRGIIGSNGNMAPYNRFVQSRQHQARIHVGRWQTIESVAEDSEATVQRLFADRLRAAGLDR